MGSSEPRKSSAGPGSADNDKFIELDCLRMVGNNNITKGIISQRKSNGAITFSIVREFSRDGIPDWTSYFSEAQIDDFEQMLQMVKKRISELRADPKVAPLRASSGAR